MNDYLRDLSWGFLSPQQARIPEGKVSTALGVGLRVSDDDVIHQFDFENLCGLPQNSRHADVSLAGGRVTARMVVLCCECSYVMW